MAQQWETVGGEASGGIQARSLALHERRSTIALPPMSPYGERSEGWERGVREEYGHEWEAWVRHVWVGA